jgi:hypothetical protein
MVKGETEFESESYKVVIQMPPHREGAVVFDEIQFEVLNKITGQKSLVKGSAKHHVGADGVTPGRFLGYVFGDKLGDKSTLYYFLDLAGDKPALNLIHPFKTKR